MCLAPGDHAVPRNYSVQLAVEETVGGGWKLGSRVGAVNVGASS